MKDDWADWLLLPFAWAVYLYWTVFPPHDPQREEQLTGRR